MYMCPLSPFALFPAMGFLIVPGTCHFSQAGCLVSSGNLPASITSTGVAGVGMTMLLFAGAGDLNSGPLVKSTTSTL